MAWLVMRLHRWDKFEWEHAAIPYPVTVAAKSRGFCEVFETAEQALAEYPGGAITRNHNRGRRRWPDQWCGSRG